MNTVTAALPASRTPWHLWAVGTIGLLWNGFGAYDYLMTHTQKDAYMRAMGMTEPQIAYILEMPAWMTAVWAIGVWGAVLATVFLLLRKRWAVPTFAVSLGALLVSLLYSYLLSNGAELMGAQGTVMNAVITIAAILFLWYARSMDQRGVLR